jgi:hypothetical protein
MSSVPHAVISHELSILLWITLRTHDMFCHLHAPLSPLHRLFEGSERIEVVYNLDLCFSLVPCLTVSLHCSAFLASPVYDTTTLCGFYQKLDRY